MLCNRPPKIVSELLLFTYLDVENGSCSRNNCGLNFHIAMMNMLICVIKSDVNKQIHKIILKMIYKL